MSKPYHVYLDLDVLNNNTDPTLPAPALCFEETFTRPFLDGTADDYFVAIARFSIQTGGTLPVFIPAIQTGQGDVNKTVYIITLTYNGVSGTGTIEHVPQPTAQVPSVPTTSQDLTTDYYYIYNYQDWIGMVNTAFQTAFSNLLANLTTASIYNSVSNTTPTALDGFFPQAPVYTQIISLTASAGGAASVGPFIYTSSVPLLNIGTTGIVKITNSDGSITFITNTGNTTTLGVKYYSYSIQIKTVGNIPVSSASNVSNTLYFTSTIGASTLVNSASAVLTITNTITTAAVAGASVPFMQFDTSTQKCTINSDLNWFNSSNTTGAGCIFSTPGSMSYLQASPFSFEATIQET